MPTLRDLDPAVQSIFDAMVAYMAATYTGMTCTVNFDGMGTRETVNCTQPNNDNWQYVQYTTGDKVAIAPLTASLGPAATQQFTASATDASGNPIATPSFVWTVQPGGLGTIDATGLYTAPAAIAAASTDTVKCQLTGQNSWATVTVGLHP